jgi:ubiquinol-cytochrome c reductase cytochrome c1 subunit
MMRPFRRLLAAALLTLAPALAGAAESEIVIPKQDWPHAGPFGTLDQRAAQRGLQVYREVCATCHSLRLVPFRALAGIGYDEPQIKALAAQAEVEAGPNDQGELVKRPGTPADRFPHPYANDNAAKAANNGALPPDLSLIAKAREHGEDYLYAYLTGFTDPPPKGVTVMEGMHYNAVFPGHQAAMPNVLTEGGVTYQDGTKATVAQQARDVTAFLAFTAEPHQDARKRMGVKVMLFLAVFAVLLYLAKNKLWGTVH